MLLPDSRKTAFELIQPPGRYRLDFAVLTTYTLDLEALLVLPLSVLAHPDGGLDELLADPLRLHQAIRDAGGRVHAFVDETGIGIPRSARPLYSLLESSVHPVRAPGRGAFHPKVWVARFAAKDETAEDLLRVAILSRNLTFDRSWDVALASAAPPGGGRRVSASRPLGDFLRELPNLATSANRVPQDVADRVEALADQVARTAFPAPEGFDSPIEFHALGLSRRRRSWSPPSSGYRTLALAPFVNQTGLAAIDGLSGNDRTLVSRQEELDKLSEDALAAWKEIFVLSDTAQGEAEDVPADADEDGEADQAGANGDDPGTGVDARQDGDTSAAGADARQDGDSSPTGADARPSGLHAKMIAVEHGWDATWYVGSANLTSAAFGGSNVEVMASVTGKKGRKEGASGCGIDRFLHGGFLKLCVPYRRVEPEPEDQRVTDARARLEAARDALVDADLRVVCVPGDDLWTLTIDGSVAPPADDVEVAAWPVSVGEDQALRPGEPLRWRLPLARLTAFIAFRLRVPVPGVDDIRMTLRLPAEGMPADRLHHVLRGLLDSPEKFLRFLRALLGGLDAVAAWTKGEGQGDGAAPWGVGLGGETLLDDLVRTASRDPDRLKPVRRLIDDLRKTEEGRRIVPDDLLAVWTAVEEAVAGEPRS
ncbi:MAG: phospholipase D family protein [Acidobacteriota bacterium]|nr:phospholipase D family protein [Acidobacteriota bacterium]